MRETRRAGLAAAATAVALMLVGCGGGDDDEPEKPEAPTGTTAAPEAPPTVDATKVEAALKRSLRVISLPALPTTLYPRGGGPPEQQDIGGGRVKVRSVTCPEDVPIEKGEAFDCEMDAGKTTATVRVTQLDNRGKRLRYKATFESEAEGIPVTTKLSGRITVK